MYYFNCWAYLQKILKHVKKRQNFIPILKPLRVSYSPKYLKRTKGPVKDHLYIKMFFPKKVCIENKETFQRMYHKPLPHQLFFMATGLVIFTLDSIHYTKMLLVSYLLKNYYLFTYFILFLEEKKTKEIHFYIEIK